jgi:hypothetical protein
MGISYLLNRFGQSTVLGGEIRTILAEPVARNEQDIPLPQAVIRMICGSSRPGGGSTAALFAPPKNFLRSIVSSS